MIINDLLIKLDSQERGVPQEKNPFFHFKITKAKTERHKLSIQEIEAIEALDLEHGSLIWHVRNYFLFVFYCAGIRFGDLARLRCCNVADHRLAYTMGKTGTGKSFKLIPQAQEIAHCYVSDADINANPDAFLSPSLPATISRRLAKNSTRYRPRML